MSTPTRCHCRMRTEGSAFGAISLPRCSKQRADLVRAPWFRVDHLWTTTPATQEKQQELISHLILECAVSQVRVP